MAKDRSGVEYLGVAKRGKHRGEKRWELRITWYDIAGNKKDATTTVSADTKHEARNKRKAFLDEKIAESKRTTERKSIREVRELWLATIDRYATKKQWKSISKLLCEWKPPALKGGELGDVLVEAATPPLLQGYMAKMAAEEYAPTTMDAHRAAVGLMFAFAKAQGFVATNAAADMTTLKPKVTGPIKDKRKPKALTPEQFEQFIVYIEKKQRELYTMLITQYVVGSRFAEVSALWLEDMDFSTGLVEICRGQVDGRLGPPKNNEARTTAVGMSTLKLLIEHRDRMQELKWPGYETLLFPRPLFFSVASKRQHNYWAYSTVKGMITRAFDALGFDMGAVTHVARHTMNNTARMYGSEAFMRRVREQIGHADEARSRNYSEQHAAEALQVGQSIETVLLGSQAERGAVVLDLRQTPRKPQTQSGT